ncbi:MAG: Asp-tRNA(Asn)/Glu-tRNA(Gln) amidotransferase GatCAB subunit B [Bacteroidetes bacterium MED-G17]|nr:MAG: glutaminyl-tRNA synthase (glutamine-hydrolyzing) subunit B [Bacteroidetes bacterium TMED39]PDH51345.1 MAG: Asp-tRNA(Asn)/Glu-tRNA(Gln) amidotransferase GatCAB subunit B [Bacteroidetes bacterium MED-G17]|tara:strand:+ start:541 stop:1995 length:1455 start_codon:yes stop_codon:yes gene_type:complete
MSNFKEKYELVAGLEVHIQLLTNSKAFSDDVVNYGDAPNTNISVVSLGYPGTLPVHNKNAVVMAIKLGLACRSDIREKNIYARKNYFYADLPKGYQITQHTTPICNGGKIEITLKDGTKKSIELTRIHMEEDAGKSIHDQDINHTLVDFNRAGTALLEMVTEPVFRSSDEAYAYLTEVRRLVRYLEISDGNMEEGSLRCDANISVRQIGASKLGTKVEVKNMNSISNVKKAIEFEFDRQCKLIELGEEVFSETRSFQASDGTTKGMRAKELVNDYRYFPEPDLPPLLVSKAFISEVKQEMPKLPNELFEEYTQELLLSDYDAKVLIDSKELSDYFQDLIQHTHNYKAACNWLTGDVKGYLKKEGIDIKYFQLVPEKLAALIKLVEDGLLSYSVAAQKIFPALVNNQGLDPKDFAESNNLIQNSDNQFLHNLIEEVLGQFPDKVAAYKSGKKGLMGLFVGQVMKKSQGKADPKETNKLLSEILDQ